MTKFDDSGPAFKAEIRHQGLTQRQVAALTGTHESTVSKWCAEGGEPPPIAWAWLRAFGQVPEIRRKRLFPAG